MTENKRFKGFYIEDKGWGISDTITNTDWLIETRGDLEEFLKVLNEQHEEIQQLQTSNKSLRKMNVELKKQIIDLGIENEQLKQLIKKVLETTPIEHSLAMELKNSVRELYD